MIIDLCSGYGGATQAFLDEDVVKIDIDPKTKPTIIADVNHLPLRLDLKPDLLWASPPCTYFSIARTIYPFNPKGLADSLRLVASVFDAIDYLKPKRWIIENPAKGLRFFIGPPVVGVEYSQADFQHKKADLWSNHRSLKRAFIPEHINNSIKKWLYE